MCLFKLWLNYVFLVFILFIGNLHMSEMFQNLQNLHLAVITKNSLGVGEHVACNGERSRTLRSQYLKTNCTNGTASGTFCHAVHNTEDVPSGQREVYPNRDALGTRFEWNCTIYENAVRCFERGGNILENWPDGSRNASPATGKCSPVRGTGVGWRTRPDDEVTLHL